MDTQQRQQRFHDAVARLLADERALVDAIAARGVAVEESAEARTVLQRLGDQAAENATALTQYLAQVGGAPSPATSTFSIGDGHRGPVLQGTAALQEVFTRVNALAIGYTALDAMAMRLFEPPLRVLAPRHLRVHTAAAQAITALLPRVVAAELAAEGLTCMCPCPMCSIGICGCVAGATTHVADAWRETAPESGPAPGYYLHRPRPGSQLEALGIPDGARLLTVADKPVTASPYDVQGKIRQHPAPAPIRLRIRTDDDREQEVTVTRVDHEAS